MLHYHTERYRIGKTYVSRNIQECLSPLVTSSGHFSGSKGTIETTKSWSIIVTTQSGSIGERRKWSIAR